MPEHALDLARNEYARGNYSACLEHARRSIPHHKSDSQERDCLICECLQYQGEHERAIAHAEDALQSELPAAYVARYWGVIGRTRLEQHRLQEAAEACRKGIRAGARTSDFRTLTHLQQLLILIEAQNLGNGLTSAVREAYHSAVKSTDSGVLAGFHLRLLRLEAERGAFDQAMHHLSLAESLINRTDNVAVGALLQVNKSGLLGMVGSLTPARKAAEAAWSLAESAGHMQLAFCAAANVSHWAVTAGDLSIAESWLKKARKLANKLNITEIALLESYASYSLLRGDFENSSRYLAEIRRLIESRDLKRITDTETYSLHTDLYLQKTLGNEDQQTQVLKILREAANTRNTWHGNFLVTLAEAEVLFDKGDTHSASKKTASCIEIVPSMPLVYLAELHRLAARDLWIQGHTTSARRRLARASAANLVRGSRRSWIESLRELRSTKPGEAFHKAYSLDEQLHQANSKFGALMNHRSATWFDAEAQPPAAPRDAIDGFDDAIAILESTEDPELLAREAFAAAVALDVCVGAALAAKTDAGQRIVTFHGWDRSVLEEKLRTKSGLVGLEIASVGASAYVVFLEAREDIRSLFVIAGIRRIIEAARTLQMQKKDQQRLGALWQPEIIIEEPDAVFTSPQMIELMQTAQKVAVTSLPVLLMGQTGTGKEVVARAIHRASTRANQIFLPFNCSAVPRDMIESQLFGYRRGSFTGAHTDFPGIIRSAEGGTLFLDEIGELSMELQPKLLRFLETNEVHPLGEGKPIKVDVRVIAATNADLDDLIEKKEFREDLYYRLNIVRFQMPQLAERREEIPPLVMHLLRRFEMDEKKHSIKISDELMEYLLLYKWPGNVRQLSNELRKMTAMVASGDTLTPEHLSPAIRATRRTVPADPDAEPPPPPEPQPADPDTLQLKLDQPLHGAVEALERAMIERAIARTEGRIEEAARLLGISRKGLFLKRRRWHSNGETPPGA